MDDLYRENILEHYKRPHNWGELEDPDLEFEDTNPLCGDELKVSSRSTTTARVAGRALLRPRLRDLARPSASMASDEVIGMPVDDLLAARPRRSSSTCSASTSPRRA